LCRFARIAISIEQASSFGCKLPQKSAGSSAANSQEIPHISAQAGPQAAAAQNPAAVCSQNLDPKPADCLAAALHFYSLKPLLLHRHAINIHSNFQIP